MLKVDRITNGTVLDHIQGSNGFEVFKRLKLLYRVEHPVALLMNVHSTKMEKKDMIKISDTVSLDLTMLGLLDPGVTVNYIENGKVTKKLKPGLPKKVVGLIDCKNPRCITASDRHADSIFTLVDEMTKKYECFFCGERVKV